MARRQQPLHQGARANAPAAGARHFRCLQRSRSRGEARDRRCAAALGVDVADLRQLLLCRPAGYTRRRTPRRRAELIRMPQRAATTSSPNGKTTRGKRWDAFLAGIPSGYYADLARTARGRARGRRAAGRAGAAARAERSRRSGCSRRRQVNRCRPSASVRSSRRKASRNATPAPRWSWCRRDHSTWARLRASRNGIR